MTLEQDLARLVAFPTISHHPVTALAGFLAERLDALGFRIERCGPATEDRYNLVASIGPPSGEGLVISGHMDVVPTEGQPWSSDPFRVEERDGMLYGRGTADMKGFLACTLAALERIGRPRWARELVLVWTHDEEVGCRGSARLADEFEQTGRRLPRACLVGEPTDFRILRMHPGHVGVEVDLEGLAAHSSRPDLGRNAISMCAEVVRRVDALTVQVNRELEARDLRLPVNVALVEGGQAINIVPDHCRLQIGYRPPPGVEVLGFYERIVEALADMEGVTCRVMRSTPPLLTPRGTPLEDLLRVDARDPEPTAGWFSTDGANLSRMGCAPLVFGPGSIEVAHRADEYIPRAALHQGVDVVERVIRKVCLDG